MLEQYLEVQLAQMGAACTFSLTAERVIAELLTRTGDASLDRLSERLGLSRWTIQKRLAEEGVTYQELLDAVRERLARRYLAQRELSIPGIAMLLGYADVKGLYRAFKRWTGQTPAAHRRALREGE